MKLSLLVLDKKAKKKIDLLQTINTYFSVVYLALFLAPLGLLIAIQVSNDISISITSASNIFAVLFAAFILCLFYSAYNIYFRLELKSLRNRNVLLSMTDNSFKEYFASISVKYDRHVSTERKIYICLLVIFFLVWILVGIKTFFVPFLDVNSDLLKSFYFGFFLSACILDSAFRLISYLSL